MRTKEYEKADHAFRSEDSYAWGKYELTRRWLSSFWKGKALANIGCGAGDFNLLARASGVSEVRAFEPEAWAFETARRRFESEDWCRVHRRGVFELVEADFAGVDCAVMHDVLEHIESDEAAIERMASLMKPGTVFVLSVPALQALFGRHDEELGHFRRYTLGQLTKRLEPYFFIEKSRYYGFFFIPITFVLSVLLRRPYPKPGRGSMLSFAVRALCQLEVRLPLPLGTSVVIQARRKG